MIKLEVKEYCHNCPNFDVLVKKDKYEYKVNGVNDFYIYCKNATWCEQLAKTTEQRLRERGNN